MLCNRKLWKYHSATKYYLNGNYFTAFGPYATLLSVVCNALVPFLSGATMRAEILPNGPRDGTVSELSTEIG